MGTYRHLPLRAEEPEPMLQQIRDDQLDLLIFTDIGMHAASKVTSVLQLAPVQGQGWGHPITSGSRTIHYYLSGEGMEPSGNEEHYSETLYRLPDTGLNYEVPAAIHDGQLLYDKFDLPRDRPILNSLQSTFKYIPRNDWTYAEIAKRHPEAFIVLVGHMGNGGIAIVSTSACVPISSIAAWRSNTICASCPASTTATSWGLFAISHHTIDTIDWNGGNSSMQSFSLDCPVVTLPTAFMRGRHTVAMLDVLELPELIASDADDYIAISCRLLDDESFYQQMRDSIRERKSRLFYDKSVAEAFQVAVETICRQAPTVGQQPSGVRPMPIRSIIPPLPLSRQQTQAIKPPHDAPFAKEAIPSLVCVCTTLRVACDSATTAEWCHPHAFAAAWRRCGLCVDSQKRLQHDQTGLASAAGVAEDQLARSAPPSAALPHTHWLNREELHAVAQHRCLMAIWRDPIDRLCRLVVAICANSPTSRRPREVTALQQWR